MIRNFYKKLAASIALFTVELVFVWLLFIACVVVFFYISSQIVQGDELGVDQAAFNFAASIASPGFSNFIEGITFFASRQFLTPAALLLVAYFVFVRKHRWYSLKVPVVALGSITLNVVLKYFFDRPRPLVPMVEAHGLSFPSGHTMVAASFYGLLIYLVWHNVKQVWLRNVLIIFLSVFVIFIGFSRIYLRVHYATDVLAGFAAGFMWVVIGIWILNRLERYSRKEITPVLLDDPVEKS
ncbi:phosphatase PAP2 family protein [Pontibacter sp. Tf4]|uniref:phosphatase PAP2 family protein n=1 Tax=Pontibacter sp. Tf4 TaxID=2761620 RepID=UPI00162723C6|nr:phosphatase PAP2 family protein [Pontibacter sp. Tf4]MBB6612228.1 phosphatase PAP2 family protein [Pontibacter sp. Tf4]